MSFILDNLMIYEFEVVLTQTDVGGGSVNLRIRPATNSYFIISNIGIGPDDYTSAHNIIAHLNNVSSGKHLANYFQSTAIDNNRMFIPAKPSDQAADGSTLITDLIGKLVVNATEIRIGTPSGVTLAQNETISVQGILLLEGDIPSFANDGSGTITKNELISKPRY